MADWIEDWAKRLDRRRNKAAKQLSKVYQAAGREILGSLLSSDGAMDAQRNASLMAQILNILAAMDTRAALVLGTALHDAFRDTERDILLTPLLQAALEDEAAMGMGIAFNRINHEVVRVATSASLGLIQAVGEDVKSKIRQQMAISLVRGEHPRQLAKRLVGTGLTTEGGHTTFYTTEIRAQVIARTETARVQTLAAEQTIKQAAEVLPHIQMEWSAALERACPVCRSLDGLRRPVGETFNGFMPPRHPRCRCALVPYVPRPSERG